jgi:CoA:oxalate CoA-transferase
MESRPLQGVRVLDVSHIIAGPFCTMLLANAGAEIIKVEPPSTGEMSRRLSRPIQVEASEPITLQYVRVNRGKKGLTLNLRHERGKALFKRLAAISDVVVENFRPGTMKKLGLDYEALGAVNPELIYATISGYGRREDRKGPYSDWPANNPSAQAMSGLMDVTGEPGGPPSLVGASIGDTIPALWAAYGILLALEHRRKTGRGQQLDIAMYDCLVMTTTPPSRSTT